MNLGNNIRYLVGETNPSDLADHYRSEAKRLRAAATRAEHQRLTITATEIRERVKICEQYVEEYTEIAAGR